KAAGYHGYLARGTPLPDLESKLRSPRTPQGGRERIERCPHHPQLSRAAVAPHSAALPPLLRGRAGERGGPAKIRRKSPNAAKPLRKPRPSATSAPPSRRDRRHSHRTGRKARGRCAPQ